jgi:dihydroneopterin aldolase
MKHFHTFNSPHSGHVNYSANLLQFKKRRAGFGEIWYFRRLKNRIMGTILLEGMEFFAFHGCFKEEQIIGSKFIVDLSVEVDTTIPERSDNLHDTADYVGLYRCVKREMEQKSHLLEHVARRILDAVRSDFQAVSSIELKIAKMNPPMGGKMHQVSFKTQWRK